MGSRWTPKEARKELRRRAWDELRKRDPVLYKAEVKAAIIASFTRKQLAVYKQILAGTRYIAMCCSRRAGKTNFICKLIFLKMLDAGHNQACFFVAETLARGKRIVWKDFERLVTTYQTGWRLNSNMGEVTTSAGAAFFIQGLNKQKQTNATRGFKALLFCIDECQDQEHLLDTLIGAVGPALSDLRGVFIAAGTPGWAESGKWHEWVHGTEQEPSPFLALSWTVRDNEKFPRDVDEMLAEERALHGYSEDHPDYQREWMGIWATDTSKFAFEFLAGRNTLTELPEDYDLHWRHVIGIDYGWDDAAAWVVVAANPYGPERIVVHAESHPKLDNDQAAEITKKLVEEYATTYVVCDPAGGGKTFYETFNRRYGDTLKCQIRSANKLRKVDSVKVINADLRNADGRPVRLKLLMPKAQGLAKELRQLRWLDKAKGELLTTKSIRDDMADAFRYAMVEIAPWRPREETEKDKDRDHIKVKSIADKKRELSDEERELEARNKAARKAKKQQTQQWAWRR